MKNRGRSRTKWRQQRQSTSPRTSNGMNSEQRSKTTHRFATTCSLSNLQRFPLHKQQQEQQQQQKKKKIQRHGRDFISATPPANSSRFSSFHQIPLRIFFCGFSFIFLYGLYWVFGCRESSGSVSKPKVNWWVFFILFCFVFDCIYSKSVLMLNFSKASHFFRDY